MENERIFYKLADLSNRWKRPENEILQIAANGNLTLLVLWSGYLWEQDCSGKWKEDPSGLLNDFIKLDKIHALELAAETNVEDQQGVEINSCYKMDGTKIIPIIRYSKSLDPHGEFESDRTVFCPRIQKQALCIMADEVLRYERNNPDILIIDNTTEDEHELKGNKAIAYYLNVSLSTLKNLKRGPNPPPIKTLNGSNRASKRELDAWRRKKEQKK